MKIDYVLSYIDYNTQDIQDLYQQVTGNEYNFKYNYTYIDLELVIRLIFKNLSFINKLYLVCKDIQVLPEHIEELINEYNGKIIRINESQIMPNNYISFSSGCIEMFIWKIPGLSEHFIYACDDMIPLKPLNIKYFFKDNKIINQIKYLKRDFNCLYDLHCLNNTNLIFNRHQNNGEYNKAYMTEHTFRALKKSICKECYNKYKKYILGSLSPYRYYNNFNMDLYVLYAFKNELNINEIPYYFFFTNLEDNINIFNQMNILININKFDKFPEVMCLNDNISKEELVVEISDRYQNILLKILEYEY